MSKRIDTYAIGFKPDAGAVRIAQVCAALNKYDAVRGIRIIPNPRAMWVEIRVFRSQAGDLLSAMIDHGSIIESVLTKEKYEQYEQRMRS